MKHKTKIKSLCYFLIQGHGINEALAELGLTPTYLSRLRRSDRVKLHQARNIFVEGLQRDLANRARLGRHTGTLKRVIDDLPPLDLPGDDEDQERADRKRSRRSFKDVDDGEIIRYNGFTNYLPETISGIREEDLEGFEDDDEDTDPTEEAPAAPRTSPQARETPSAASIPHPVEDADQQAPEPKPKTHWFRLYTGRAVQRDEDGKVVAGPLMPNQNGYPHESEFVNWN